MLHCEIYWVGISKITTELLSVYFKFVCFLYYIGCLHLAIWWLKCNTSVLIHVGYTCTCIIICITEYMYIKCENWKVVHPYSWNSEIIIILWYTSVVPILGFAFRWIYYRQLKLPIPTLYIHNMFTPFPSICSCTSLIFSTALYSHFCWKMKLTNY